MSAPALADDVHHRRGPLLAEGVEVVAVRAGALGACRFQREGCGVVLR